MSRSSQPLKEVSPNEGFSIKKGLESLGRKSAKLEEEALEVLEEMTLMQKTVKAFNESAVEDPLELYKGGVARLQRDQCAFEKAFHEQKEQDKLFEKSIRDLKSEEVTMYEQIQAMKDKLLDLEKRIGVRLC